MRKKRLASMSAFGGQSGHWLSDDPKRTFPFRHGVSPALLKRRHHINPVEHFQHDGVGRRLTVEGDGQVGPDDQRYVVDRIVAHEGVVAGHLAAVKIQTVRPKRHLSDPIPVFLAERLAWILFEVLAGSKVSFMPSGPKRRS